MAKLDQRRFDNQRSGAEPEREWLNAREAAAELGVKLATLYAYASRGLIHSVPERGRRGRHYARADVLRLKLRSAARAGHGAVAAGALAWGEPVLDSSITELGERGPVYRGHVALELAASGVHFEAVAELLWTGRLEPQTSWSQALARIPPRQARALAQRAPTVLGAFSLVPLVLDERASHAVPDAVEHGRGRKLIAALAQALIERATGAPATPRSCLAELLARGLGKGSKCAAALDQALILSADHELNVSAFTARVVASAGSDLYACVSAAMCALSGPRHGGLCDRVEALLAETESPRAAADVVQQRAARGDGIPGFGHPQYPGGDPRARALLDLAAQLAGDTPAVATLLALARAMHRAGHEPPALDFGLVAVAQACRLPPGSAAALFALGRSAGFIAHVLEQRRAQHLLRPRARYVAPSAQK